MATRQLSPNAAPPAERPVGQLALVVFVGLGVVVATMRLLPELALLACSLTIVAAAWFLHVAIRRVHHDVLALDDAVSSIALDSAADRNTVASVLRHARTLTSADRSWLVVQIDGHVSSIGFDGTGVAALDVTTFDRIALESSALDGSALDGNQAPIRRPRGSGSPSRHVLVVPLPVQDQRAVLVVGRDGRFSRFATHYAQLLERMGRHAAAAMTQRQIRGHLEAESDRHRSAAAHDPLTGLVNRQEFRDLAAGALAEGTHPALVLISLDRFKRINDHLGLQAGDQFLAEIADRIRRTSPDGARVARLGGDEFAVMITGAPAEDDLHALADALHASLTTPMVLESGSARVGVSLGVAMCGWGSDEIGDLLRRADVAMSTAKKERTGIEFFRNDLDRESIDRIELLPELREAIGSPAMTLVYQPQIRLDDATPIAVEALLRWTTPGGRVVPPEVAVQLADDTDVIGELTAWTFRRALQDCVCWWDPSQPIPVAVNLSGRALIDADLTTLIAEILAEVGLPVAALRVEITELGVSDRLDRAATVLRELRAMGVTVSLDDFGTGQSALAHLMALPVDQVKIDESLVADVGHPDATDRYVHAIIQLAAGLGLQVVAEGVESQRQADRLRELGCGAAQGFHVSRPLPVTDVSDWIAEHRPAAPTPPARRLLYIAPAGVTP